MPASYAELHAKSAFSWHRGASCPRELAERSAEVGLSAIALCDRDGVFGLPRLHFAGKATGVRAIVGCELTLEDEAVLPVLVESRAGYQNLCRLLSQAKLRAPKNQSRVGWEELAEHAEGLVALTGDDEGSFQQALGKNDRESAQSVLNRLVEVFGSGSVYVEVQRHRVRGEERIIKLAVQLAQATRLPLLATNGVSYARAAQRPLLDAFTCLRLHTHLDAAGDVLARNGEAHLKGPQQMAALFADLPEAIANTVQLAERLEFSLENLGYAFPEFPVAPGETMLGRLREETFRGARDRYGKVTTKIRRQLEHELDLIGRLGFEGYFLIVWDMVRFARDEDILVQGRGSAANSAVCYSLGITAVDPIGGKLLFERFLSEGRQGWPDIDLDLPSGDRRERVIQEVYRRFAPTGAGMTANVITYRGKSAFREMAKVLNFTEDVMGRFSDLFGYGDFPHTIELTEQITKAGVPKNHPRLRPLVGLYQMVYGLPRHLGQHSGGMVICSQGLDSIVPLENAAMPGRRVVQWDKDDCEDLGIIKVDFLGLGMMACIQDTLTLCSERGRPVDLAKIPQDDPPTYEAMQKADTIGVFQIESRAQQATLPRLKPKCFYDVAVSVAIIRPGPIAGNLTHPYLNRRDGKEPIDYIDPRLEPVLKRTLGIPLFQEQVLKIAMVLADFTGSEAEDLRRAMGFNRDDERLRRVASKLHIAMQRKKVQKEAQKKVLEAIRSFALYGFPESHAVSFALLAYASTWLKVHRAVEFYAGLLNNQPMGFYSPATLIKDAKRHGIRVRPVCVKESGTNCQVEDNATLRLGLCTLKGLSAISAERIVSERGQAPWRGLDDFLLRTQLPKDERRVLAQAGALNCLSAHRRDALWKVECFTDPGDLFVHASRKKDKEREAPRLRVMNALDRLNADYQTQDLTTGPHPMAYVREQLPDVWPAKDLAKVTTGQRVTIGGMVICRQRPGTAKGHVFVSLEDETGIANAFVPGQVFERERLVITQESFLLITGVMQRDRGAHSVKTETVEPLAFGSLAAPSHDFH